MSTKDLKNTIAGSLVADIVLLSTWLNGQESVSIRPLHRDRSHSSLSILTHLSTILTIGNQAAPRAHNVHAVIGIIDQDRIQCLVFTENAGVKNDVSLDKNVKHKGRKPKAGPSDVRYEPLDNGNPSHGQELLKAWAPNNKDEKIQ